MPNLNDMIAALWGPAQAAPTPTAPSFVKDQSRVVNPPWPLPLAVQSDVPRGMTIAGSTPILPQGFSKR